MDVGEVHLRRHDVDGPAAGGGHRDEVGDRRAGDDGGGGLGVVGDRDVFGDRRRGGGRPFGDGVALEVGPPAVPGRDVRPEVLAGDRAEGGQDGLVGPAGRLVGPLDRGDVVGLTTPGRVGGLLDLPGHLADRDAELFLPRGDAVGRGRLDLTDRLHLVGREVPSAQDELVQRGLDLGGRDPRRGPRRSPSSSRGSPTITGKPSASASTVMPGRLGRVGGGGGE